VTHRSTVEQDPITKLWYWYDETWNKSHRSFATRTEAAAELDDYVERELEGTMWGLKAGDYVWWEDPKIPCVNRTPAQVVSRLTEGRGSWPNADWLIRTLTGSQNPQPARNADIESMADMEVIAIAAAWDVIL